MKRLLNWFAGQSRTRKILFSSAAGLVVCALVVGLVFAAIGSGTRMPTPTQSPTPTPTPTPTMLRTCSVADRAGDPRLAQLQAQVTNATTGEVLFDRGGSTASRAASVTKVPTMAAALAVLGPDFRATTKTVAGTQPGSVVLVGGGDLTLSRTPSGHRTAYGNVAHLDDLAAQTLKAYQANPANAGVPLTTVIYDSSYFGGPAWEPSWNSKEIGDGYMPNITALMVDGDRQNPDSGTSPRGSDPAKTAASAFASALGASTVTAGKAPAGAATLGTVSSPTVAALMERIITYSDNTAAEMLARLTAIASGAGNTFTAIDAGVKKGLSVYGLDTSALHFADGSGLSDNNAITPDYLNRLFIQVAAKADNLGYILDALPVAGEKGSLSYGGRFDGENAVADGSVLAKTGWIDTGYTLAGIIHAKDGTLLTFTIYALGNVDEEAKQAIDTLATGFYLCGNTLSNK